MAKSYSSIGISNIGQREENQDRYKILGLGLGDEWLIVVADGLGGHKGGAIAAEAIIDAASRCWQDRARKPDNQAFLLDLVQASQQAVQQAAMVSGLEPRSAIAALMIRNDQAISVHVGDCRVIQIQDEKFIKRTLDHSVAQIHVLQGRINDDEMGDHRDQNRLTSCIGGDEGPDPELERWDMSEHCTFIVCSDGFWELFTQEEMIEFDKLALTQANLENLVQERIDARTQHDNTTAVLLRLRSLPVLQPRKKPEKKRRGVRTKWLSLLLIGLLLVGVWLLLQKHNRTSNQDAAVPVGALTESSGPPAEDEALAPMPGEIDQIFESRKEGGFRETENNRNPGPAPIDTVNKEVSEPVDNMDQVAEKTGDVLRRDGLIGTNDSLLSDSGAGTAVGEAQIIRMQQEYKGVPVYSAELRATVKGGKIIHISGKPVSDIEIDIKPVLTYSEVIERYKSSITQNIKAEKTGQLLIFKEQKNYRLAWSGIVTTDGVDGKNIFSADDASLLVREELISRGNEAVGTEFKEK